MSLRLRLFLTYTAVVLVSLLTIAIGLTVLLRGYADRVSRERLELTARPIQVQAALLVRKNATQQEIFDALQEQSDNNHLYLILIDNSGNILKEIYPQQLGMISLPLGSLPQEINHFTGGRFRTIGGTLFLYAAYPLSSQNSQVTGASALVLAVPRPSSLAVLGSLTWPFLLAAGISLVISLLFSLWLGRSIYRPLAGVKAAAQRVAQGDYAQRVPEEGSLEVRELASSFNHMAGEVEQSQMRLRHFVADVSHELKSPLTSIQGFAQALLDGTAADEETRTKAAHIIDSEARRLKRQVDELLELSRMQSGQARLAKEPVDMSDVLTRSVDIYSVQAKEKQVELSLNIAPGLIVDGDADRLEQVFNNLLDNAIKNSPAGSAVSITSKNDGKLARVTVTDSGPGISAEHLPHVFERFYQVTGVRTGVGLGLTIAREIILTHGGTIEVSGQPGEGARFTVNLPESPAV
jgi:two-component system, OmpR family, sensor kinase